MKFNFSIDYRECSRLFCFTLMFVFISNGLHAQEILPFPKKPSQSEAGLTIQESIYNPADPVKRISDDAPNILIILIDDIGNGTSTAFGGEINTPTIQKIADMGVTYNRFHSTAMCSPSRSSILTGRNHTAVGNGQIAELANDWDGFTGVIPKTAATMAEVLKNYGYNTSAFGKWHNSPAEATTSKGPFDSWPTSYGFEYFYGFLAGEASQYEPSLVRNTTIVAHPETSGGHNYYHVTEDIADDAIKWLREQKAFSPDSPFMMYWAPGAVHGPHQVTKYWADKYKGKFDNGWDEYRKRVYKRQIDMGWIPENTVLTERDTTMAAWADIPADERAFQLRLMELFAGFAEHTDYHAGRIIAELERLGELDNTLVFYIWGDNGSSAEGQNGTISELLAQNGIPTTIDQHITALNKLGGLDVLGSAKTDNMYHAGWAWAGSTPYKSTKLVAAHFGGTRQPMAVSWPKGITPDKKPRSQFHHFNDIVPTVYEVVGITPPEVVNGVTQKKIDGVSFAYTFNDSEAEGRLKTQFFDIMGSRGIYHDGWFAGTFGPRVPWVPGISKSIFEWNPENDIWELYNIDEDWSQANNLADANPSKLQEMKSMFLVESAKNDNLPIGGGLWSVVFHPEDAPQTPYDSWRFVGDIDRMPEFAAPKLGKFTNTVNMKVKIPKRANGVLYSLGGFGGGLSLFVENGYLIYEYNLFEIDRTVIRSKQKLPVGEIEIQVNTVKQKAAAQSPIDVTIMVNGKTYSSGTVPVIAALTFTANDCLDFGKDLGSPVSTRYFNKAPFKFNGEIIETTISYPKPE